MRTFKTNFVILFVVIFFNCQSFYIYYLDGGLKLNGLIWYFKRANCHFDVIKIAWDKINEK